MNVPLRVWTDSSAAIGICSRQGLGKLRHLDTHTLWVQQAVRNRRIDLRKIAGESNPADLLTKHSLSREKLHSLVRLYDCEFRDGRAESAPKLRRGTSGKRTMADDGRLDAVTEEEEEAVPWMPHNCLSRLELDNRFPPLEAPEDECLEDVACDEDDPLLQYGRKVAQQIAEDMAVRGRTRRDAHEDWTTGKRSGSPAIIPMPCWTTGEGNAGGHHQSGAVNGRTAAGTTYPGCERQTAQICPGH